MRRTMDWFAGCDASCWIKKMAGRQLPSGHLTISG
jgi:hypothetical protein